MRKKSIIDTVLIFCWGVLIFFFISITIRFLTRQILVKELCWDNAFTRIVFAENQSLNDLNKARINWAKEYSFHDSAASGGSANMSMLNRFENIVFFVENKIKPYHTDFLIGQYGMEVAAESYNNLIGCPVIQARSSDQIIYLENGYLADENELISNDDIAEIADSVQDFSTYLDKQGIGFVYMNTGSKVCPYDKQLPSGANEHTNENADKLIDALKGRNVNTLDFRDCMIQDGLDWYQSYYITDHHWKTTTALWAAGVMAQYLNDNFGFDFDQKFFDATQYDIETYSDYFLGGQGRIVTLSNCGLEDYDKILPKFDTSFSLIIPSQGIDMQGSYQDVLFCKEEFEKIAKYSKKDYYRKKDAYSMTQLTNEPYSEVKNLNPENNRDKKILLIYDSFSWYSASYLATDVSEIVTIHPASFTGSVRTLVDEMKPDVVVMAYCAKRISPIKAQTTHTDMFDLR